MDGINFLKDEEGQTRFVQIDLSIHAELWEDFYDLLIAEERKDEESVSFEEVVNILKRQSDLRAK